MMEDWTDIIGEELEAIEEPLPADDWNVLQQKYAAARRRRKAAVFAWIGGVTSAAAAVALALLLIRPEAPSVPEGDLVADAHVSVDEIMVQPDSSAVHEMTDEPVHSVLTPVTAKSSECLKVEESDDVLFADADSEGFIQVVRDSVDVAEVMLAEATEEHGESNLDALQGQVAGVVRGVGSHRSNKAPVYIVDGFVVSEDYVYSIDPEDIESVELVKDEDSSVYGSRSSDGVVVITTKSDKSTVTLMTVGYGVRRWAAVGVSGGGVLTGAGSNRNFEPSLEAQPSPEPPDYDDPEPPTDTTANGGNAPMAMHKRKYRRTSSDSYDHAMPVSFGLSARFMLTGRFSINTGLNYTLYSSVRNGSYSAHYLGIPLRFDWQLVNRRYFNFYMGVGAQMDKCVYAKVGNERLYEKNFLFSLTGAAGLQYNITHRIGMYLEPDISISLNEGSIETYRTEHPVVISARGGLRFKF